MEVKKTILLIDDETDFVSMFRFILENSSFRVISASTPEEGLEKAKQNPDLILLDLNMPGMNGHEVCKRLKEDKNTLHIPVIMLTCQDKTIDKIEAFNLGVVDYIHKQIPTQEIIVRIKAILKRTSSAISSLTVQERNEKMMQLRKILDEKDIRTMFQPIIRMNDRHPIGYEALTRGPKGTFFENPLNLFAVADEADMSFDLDALCLAQSVKRAESFIKDRLLFLNADAGVLNSEYLRNLEFIKGTSILPSQICIEITERTCISNFSLLSKNLNTLKPIGVMFVIDDLGEGYASLKAIIELHPEFIKIDMSLIRNINADLIKQSLVQLICDLAKKINSRLIAEGIETEEEYQTLLALGLEYGQGYLFAKPTENPI